MRKCRCIESNITEVGAIANNHRLSSSTLDETWVRKQTAGIGLCTDFLGSRQGADGAQFHAQAWEGGAESRRATGDAYKQAHQVRNMIHIQPCELDAT